MAHPVRRQVVIGFDERPDAHSATLLGGKGMHLKDMKALGLNVPPGFTITTSVARAVMQHGQLPKRLAWQIARGIKLIERETGKKFGDSSNPLLLSVRSGAVVSMPGMMDTVLNLGLNPEIRDGLALCTSENFAENCFQRFTSMFADVVQGEEAGNRTSVSVPTDVWEQLHLAIAAVLGSWSSTRAQTYRKVHGISESLGTAVTVQAMAFGNRGEHSCTGVAFSRDPNTGKPQLFGEYLPMAQGEDVVSGAATPFPITQMQAKWPTQYQALQCASRILERHMGGIVDIEFTIEENVLYFLQCRKAKVTPLAAATFAVHQQWDKVWSREEALSSLSEEEHLALHCSSTLVVDELSIEVARGIAASHGAASGCIARTSKEAQEMSALGIPVILVRDSTETEDYPGMLVSKAIVTLEGGATSHAAVVARHLGIPAVVGARDRFDNLEPMLSEVNNLPMGAWLSVDGTSGVVYAGKLPVVQSASRTKEVNIFLKWLTGGPMPAPAINFAGVNEYRNINQALADVYLLEAMEHVSARGSGLHMQIKKLQREKLISLAEFFACYLVVAVTGEFRHYQTHCANKNMSSLDSSILLLNTYLASKSFDQMQQGDACAIPILSKMDTKSHIEFFRLAAEVFDDPNWTGNYGGRAWAEIARSAEAFLSGTYGHALFVDRVFNLRHNSGNVFDKHEMISRYTLRERLDRQLDVKRGAPGIGALYSGLVTRLNRDPAFSPEVSALWNKGEIAGLWTEEKSYGRYFHR